VRSDLQLSSGLMEWAEGQVPGNCFCVFERCRRVWSDQLSNPTTLLVPCAPALVPWV